MNRHAIGLLGATWLCIACGDGRPGRASGTDSSGGSAGAGASDAAGGSATNRSNDVTSSDGSNAGGAAGAPGSDGGAGGQAASVTAGGGNTSSVASATSGNTLPELDECPEGVQPDMTLCDPAATFGEASAVGIMQGSGAGLVAVTPDELTIVWFSPGSGAAGRYLLADRAAVDEDFGEPTELSVSLVVGLSPDGLRLVSLSPDRGSLLESVRPDKQTAFGEPGEGSFAVVNTQALKSEAWFEGALISAGDDFLVYTILTDETDSYPTSISMRSGSEPWPIGEPIENCELKAYGALRRRATGISEDGLTLFFYDPVNDLSRAAWRPTLVDPFQWFADIGPGYSMQPNADCSRLYFTSPEASLPVSVVETE